MLLLYFFSSLGFYSAAVSGDNKRRLKKWFDKSQSEQCMATIFANTLSYSF
jgi:hypothetical protein